MSARIIFLCTYEPNLFEIDNVLRQALQIIIRKTASQIPIIPSSRITSTKLPKMPNNTLQFRVAAPYDAPQVQALVESAFRAEDSRKDWTADMRLGENFRISVEEVLGQITKPGCVVLMAMDGDSLVASVELFKRSDDLARISMLSVDQRHQQGGVGRQVLAYAEDYCQRSWGVKKMGLNALSTRQQLIGWYMRRGYRKTGEQSPFPVEKFKELDLPDDLCFVEFEKELSPSTVPTEAA